MLESNFRGSPKDPLLYLGAFAILLFGFLTVNPSFFFPREDFFSLLPQEPSDQTENQNFFVNNGQDIQLNPGNTLGEAEFPPLGMVQNNSLMSISPPFSVSPQVLGVRGGLEEEKKEIIEYSVQPSDNLSLIAEKFNISLSTLLWANDLNKSSTIQPGQKLIILPVSGILHHVQNGETLSGIAEIYQGNLSEVISFNELSGEDIFIGDILIIPDGEMPSSPKYASSSPSQIPLANSYFIIPTNGNISQGLHWYNAIDFANSCGSPVYAAAEGKVLNIKYGYNFGAGNYIKVLHPNGVVTFYGHLNTISVVAGQSVSQGQIIGLVGGKPGTRGAGISTGCHLHFGVRGARNPFSG